MAIYIVLRPPWHYILGPARPDQSMADCIYQSVVYSWIRIWESMFAKAQDLRVVEQCIAKSEAMQKLEVSCFFRVIIRCIG